jgi:IS30 family transposase
MLDMKQRPRIYYTETDKSLMWDRWQKGESLNSIARPFDRHHSAIQGVLARIGGIRPPRRRRSNRSLTLDEREEISSGVVAGDSVRAMALSLGRAPSTVSREINCVDVVKGRVRQQLFGKQQHAFHVVAGL